MTQRRLPLVLGLNLIMIAGLVVEGLTAHSLGVPAAGGDYAADPTAIILGLVAKHPRTPSRHHVLGTDQCHSSSRLHVILNEEWEHHRYALRDLDAIAEKSSE